MKIDSKFSIGEKVKISLLGGEGRIVGIRFYGVGAEYEVRYFNNGEEKCPRFFEDELEIA